MAKKIALPLTHIPMLSTPPLRNMIFKSFKNELELKETDQVIRNVHHHTLKYLVLPTHLLARESLSTLHYLHDIWSKNETEDFEFSRGLEAFPVASHAREIHSMLSWWNQSHNS